MFHQQILGKKYYVSDQLLEKFIEYIDKINNYLKEHLNASILIITHYPRILEYIKPDFVHVMTDGQIKETVIKYDEDISQNQVDGLNTIFNNRLRGKPLEKIDKPMEEYILSAMNNQVNVIKPIISQMNRVIEAKSEFYLEGANKVFDFPEFKKIETARNFLSILDTKEEMLELLNSGLVEDINVYIGDENEKEELKDLSIITFKHTAFGRDLGTIGIIGPKRMNYSKVISIMKYINKKLNENNEGG